MRVSTLLHALLLILGAAGALAQTVPTGTISGRVVDGDGLPLSGTVVTASSTALQGIRSATSSDHGNYIVPFLPAGQYDVVFEQAGFASNRRTVRVQVAEAVTVNIQMSIGVLSETITVPALTDFTGTAPVGVSYGVDLIDTLPVSRDINGPVLLAPGTAATGPGESVTFAGAMSYEGLFLLNGVVLNETLRNQARPLVIEDAIEEVRILTSNISAEYGRFSGGMANAITRSGGNAFSGSFRTTFNSDGWRSLTPYERDHELKPADSIVPTYEATGGGPVIRDRLWFFVAGRLADTTLRQTTRYTNLTYEEGERDRRFEAKGTWSVRPGHMVRAAYSGRNLVLPNLASGTVMDLASLSERRDIDRLTSVNYSGGVTSSLFLEGQYSRRQYRILGLGSRFTDLIRGTMILDRSRDGARWNSPTFCGVCGQGGSETEEVRDNYNAIVKGSYYWSTRTQGAHHVVFGADAFEDSRQSDNWQSGSGYRLVANNTIIRDNGTSLYPVIQAGHSPTQAAAAYIQWNPIFASSVGSSLRTYAGFLNDAWTAGPHWTFNLGLRWERTDAKDQAGMLVSDGRAWSPRLSATWDPTGQGLWTMHGGFSRYAMGITSAIADLGSGAGRSSTFRYVYMGPSINLDSNTMLPVSAPDALATVFDWFFSNGGTNLPLRDAPTYAGVNRVVGKALAPPSTYDFNIGVGRQVGSRGSVRVDGVFREFRDFYAEQKDLTTGRATDPRGQQYDLGVIVNTNEVDRRYRALQTQLQYAVGPGFTLGGNYTLAQSRGNFDGESEAGGPGVADALFYPEYARESWSYPTGDLAIDERHNLRLWVNYQLPAWHAARADISLLQQVTSGAPQSMDAPIATGGYLANPGYLTPPVVGTYYFGARGGSETATLSSTDLSVNLSTPLLDEKLRVFVRVIVGNLFDRSIVDHPDDTVLTAVLDPTLAPFNPFTQTPIEGEHYRLGSSYGQALSADGWQPPRWLAVNAGFRF
jgi:hypothetical protein